MKKSLTIIIITILVGVNVVHASITLAPPGVPAKTMYTLDNIYNLGAGTTATLRSGDISGTTPGTASPTFHTLTEIYTNISTQIANLSNNKIAHGVSAFGYTGTLYGDTDPTKVLTTATYPGSASAGGGLLKTGQTHCNAFDTDYGNNSQIPCANTYQDGDPVNGQKGTARSYTDNGTTITDNSTGLIWQKCAGGQDATTCAGSANNFLFDDGNGNLGVTDQPALNYCETLNLAGYSVGSWRLPNIKELATLVDYGKVNPAINTIYFPNTQSDYYWSSTAYEISSNYAWGVYFYDGNVGYATMDNSYYVRCVRG